MPSIETRQCDWCKKPVSRFPSQFTGETSFCSRDCQGAYRSAHRKGPKAAHWQGGERTNDGRVYWHMPWHPGADAKGYVPRARVVAELTLGRILEAGEVVHHKDEDVTNDFPDNLEVLSSQSEHARLHGLKRSPEMMARMRAARGKAA